MDCQLSFRTGISPSLKSIFSDCDWWPPISFESGLLVSGMWEKEPRKEICTPACFPCKQLLLVCSIFTNKLQTAT